MRTQRMVRILKEPTYKKTGVLEFLIFSVNQVLETIWNVISTLVTILT